MAPATAIILAAGQSRRMGAVNKLLLPVFGKPMIRYVVEQYMTVLGGNVVVVLGHQAEEVRAALAGSGVRTSLNTSYRAGQNTSVVTGLQAAPAAHTLLIGLGDQPFLIPEDIKALLSVHHSACPDKILIPVHGDKRGNPIVVPSALRASLSKNRSNPGCRAFTQAHPEKVRKLTLTARGYYIDIDTPETYKSYFSKEGEMVR